MKNSKPLLFSIFFLLITSIFVAQPNVQKVALRNVLTQIEQQHQVNFNFIDTVVAPFSVIVPDVELPLVEKLNFISKQVPIIFTFIDSNTITVGETTIKNTVQYCGFLVDAITQNPIAGAEIALLNSKSTFYSDATGFFNIETNAFTSITISSIGYEPLSVSKKTFSSNCITLSLTPKIEALEEVVTQRYLTKGISKLKDGSIAINSSSFGLLPGVVETDVFMTMQQLPGIMSIDETVSNTNVRGGTHDQNLFLWNGIKLYQTAHFFGLVSAVNPTLSNTISITKNGTQSAYGEGVSSLVTVSSRSNTVDKTKFSFGTSMLAADGYLRFSPWKNASLELAGRRSITDLVTTPTFTNYRDRIFQNTTITDLSNNENLAITTEDDFSFYDISVLFNQRVSEKTQFSIDALLIDNSLSVDQSLTTSIGLETNNSLLNQQSLGMAAQISSNWKENNFFDAQVYGSFYKINAFNEVALNDQQLTQENNVLELGIKVANKTTFGKKWHITQGFQFYETGITSEDAINIPQFFRRVKDVLKTYVSHHEIVLSPSETSKWHGRFGIRNNYFEELARFRLEPRLQLSYILNNAITLELLAEQKSQTTSQVIDLQQDFLGLENRRWILANDTDIPLQTSNQISFGFTFAKNNWLWQCETFYKQVNGITSSAQGFQNQLEFLKITGGYTTYGTEVLLQKSFAKITAYLSYAFHSSQYDFQSFTPPQFSNNFEINHNIGSGVAMQHKGFKVALGSRWFTGRPNTLPLSFSPVFNLPNVASIAYDLPNNSNLTDYFQLNASAAYTKKWEKINLQLGVSILNILDRQNPINRHYRLNNDQTRVEEINTFGLARTLNTYLKIVF